MRQAANYNVHATESLPQSLALHFISPSGEDMDISGMTLRGAVVQDGVIMLDCAVTGASTALVTWPRLAAGCGAYDIFLTDASGKEYPLLKGAVHVVSRVTPPDGTEDAAAVAGALDVSIPETEDGSVTIVENPSIVVEELVRQAEAARDEAKRLVETLGEQVESGELVNEAVANKLPGALKDAGVELAAATGQSTLSSGDAADTWTIVGGYAMTWGDEILAGHLPDSVCEGTEMTPYALGMHAVLTPSVPGRGLITEVVNPPTVNGTMAPLMTVVVDYDDGITLGGMELATARQLDSLGRDVRQSSATAEAAARTAGQNAATASTAADNAATSATSAANSATEAQQALAAIPQVDAAGNMTLAGGLTANGTVNANGGVNIPLAVGAPTDTAAVNRLHAAGLAGVTDIFSQHAYLNTGSITATGTAATTALIPGQYAQVRVPAGTHSTIVFPFTGPNGQHNYSNFAGFSIPWRILGAGKITIGIGRGSKTTRSDLTQGSYSIIPGNNLAHNSGEILDITFDNVRDATRGGYVVKVREIYALSKAAGWRVKTTTSFVPATHNEPIPSIVNKIIYHQRTQYKFESEYISYGSLYLLTGGGQTVQLHKIAAVRGVNAFETGLGISSIVTDLPGNASGDVYMHVGSAVRTLYQPGNINPVYYALEALARNDIEAEETADFVDINIPL